MPARFLHKRRFGAFTLEYLSVINIAKRKTLSEVVEYAFRLQWITKLCCKKILRNKLIDEQFSRKNEF